MSCGCPSIPAPSNPAGCVPVNWCPPANFGSAFPDLVGPAGPPGGPGTYVPSYATLRLINASVWPAGYIAWVLGRTSINDGGQGLFEYDPTSVLADDGGTIIAPANGIGRWIRMANGEYNVRWFGAAGNGVTADQAAIAATVAAAATANPTVGAKVVVPRGTYFTTAVIAFPTTARRIHFVMEGGAMILASHNGDGLDITCLNEAYGGHTIEGLNIAGPNYPNATPGTSTGSGLVIGRNGTSNTVSGYKTTLINPVIRNFDKGFYIQCALLTRTFGGYIHFNKYGVYFDGGQSNANDFFGTEIEENRFAGVYSSGRTGGSLTYALANKFYGGIIQSNIPFPPPGVRDTTLNCAGTGVILINSQDFEFHGVYFEDHNIDVAMSGFSWGNKLIGTRHQVGAVRKPGFWFSGLYAQGNKLISAAISDGDPADIYLFTDDAGNAGNQLLDCEGFNKNFGSCVGIPWIRNNRNRVGGAGLVQFGALNQALPGRGFTGTPVPSDGPLSMGVEWDDASVDVRTKIHVETSVQNPRAIRIGALNDSVRTYGIGPVTDPVSTGIAWGITDLYENSGAAALAERRLMGFDNGDVGINRIFGTLGAAPTIASAAAIAPTRAVTFISGVAAIGSITATAVAQTGGAVITLIPTGAFTWTNAGNIAIAGTAVVGRALTMTYDSVTAKWYPSYV